MFRLDLSTLLRDLRTFPAIEAADPCSGIGRSGDQLQLRLERVEQLRFLERPGQTLGQAALRWVLAHPAVHCVVPGARTVEQLEANVPAADADLLLEELNRVKQLHAEWRTGAA